MGLMQIIGALSGRCASGHKWGRAKTRNGWKTRTCSRCGTTESTVSRPRPRKATKSATHRR